MRGEAWDFLNTSLNLVETVLGDSLSVTSFEIFYPVSKIRSH